MINHMVKHFFFELHDSFRLKDYKAKVKTQTIYKNKNVHSESGEINLSCKDGFILTCL